MKVAISAESNHLDSPVDKSFDTAKYVLVVDTDTLKFDTISCQFSYMKQEKLPDKTQFLINKGINALITCECCDCSLCAFCDAGIRVYEGYQSNIKDIISSYNNGYLHTIPKFNYINNMQRSINDVHCKNEELNEIIAGFFPEKSTEKE